MESIIIGIAGGSGSGKSTFTNRLKKHFGDDVVVIYHDNYYRRQDGIPFEERVKVNYDHPDSLETDLLVEHLKELKEGKTIQCPVYDYSQHNRSDKVLKIEPRPVILVEGILQIPVSVIFWISRFMWKQTQMRGFCDGSPEMWRNVDGI